MFHAIKLVKHLDKIISMADVIYVFYDIKEKDTNNPNLYTC